MLETFLIVFSLSIDALVVSFAYGANKTKISLGQQCIITSISSSILVSSIFIGGLLQKLLPSQFTAFICVFILATLGTLRLFEACFKHYLHKKPDNCYNLNFSFLGIHFTLKASLPHSAPVSQAYNSLTLKESCCLGAALSLDSIAVGIGIGLLNINYLQVLILSLLINLIMLSLGNLV
ncbi:MAG: manganese efflux pump, partial [Cellulosilyticaceae bacterium]